MAKDKATNNQGLGGWINFFSNPRSHYLKKVMFEVLKERYFQNEPIIERLSVMLMTESDMNQFVKMMVDVYETAYMKAVNDHKEQLSKLGINVKISQPKAG